VNITVGSLQLCGLLLRILNAEVLLADPTMNETDIKITGKKGKKVENKYEKLAIRYSEPKTYIHTYVHTYIHTLHTHTHIHTHILQMSYTSSSLTHGF
jgi:hypothetical protein